MAPCRWIEAISEVKTDMHEYADTHLSETLKMGAHDAFRVETWRWSQNIAVRNAPWSILR